MSRIRNQTIQGLTVGDTFTVSRKFTEQDMLNFADITRDYNPIHFDENFVSAKKTKRSDLPWSAGGKSAHRNRGTNRVVGLGNELSF